MIYIFIGECNELKSKLYSENYKFNFRFLGFVKDLQNTMSIGDLYLNPPRTGGGTSATYAINNEIPVLTLPNCNVALRGEEFVCSSLEKFPEIIYKYI